MPEAPASTPDTPELILHVLSTSPYTMAVKVINVDERGLTALLPARIPAGTAVRLDRDGALYLGEIVYCSPSPTGLVAGIRFQQKLGRLADLHRLVEALMPRDPEARREAAAVKRSSSN